MKDKEIKMDQDIDAIIAMLDGLVKGDVSRMKIEVTKEHPGEIKKQSHHGRCDVGSPWAKGECFDVLVEEE